MNPSCSSQGARVPARDGSGDNRLKRGFDLCVRKSRNNIQQLADGPKSAAWAVDGNYFAFPEGFYEIGNWTSSFFTGAALIAWQQTEDEHYFRHVQRLAPHYLKKVFIQHHDTHHDLGFLYTLYSVALFKLTRDDVQRDTGLRAAKVLAARFNERGHFVRAWGAMDTDEQANMAIIDCLMNLPLLFWASRETKDQRYYEIAASHACTGLKYFVRPDHTVNHAFRFDLESGKPLGADNYCGYSTTSYWARGAAWAIYGFALIYGYTGDEKYLTASLQLARKFVSELDKELVPVWDFRLPPGEPAVRDASAAAVVVCGIQELARHHVADFELLKMKNALLDRLCSSDYLDDSEACPGVLKSAYGNKIAYSSWGDYFLMEAIARELFQFEPWW
jgi:unsaturated chondroitin disaccharide hydrolase